MDPVEAIEESKAPSKPGRRILLLFAHPSLDRSEVNRPMTDAVVDMDGITLIDLYAEYPDLQIDIDREQQRLLEHDVIVFQHPLYWYSTPAILKEWQDLVLEHGFAYGSKGTALLGSPMTLRKPVQSSLPATVVLVRSSTGCLSQAGFRRSYWITRQPSSTCSARSA